MRIDLQEHELHTIRNGLSVAAERFDEHVKQFTAIAAELRAGKANGFFAPGEAGARAAERLAKQFESQAIESRAIIEGLDEDALPI